MFYVILIIAILCRFTSALENQTKILIDLYEKINTYGSLLKATEFNRYTQEKLKFTNTVRMYSYKGLFMIISNRSTSFSFPCKLVPNNRRIFAIELKKKNPHEEISLIELRCNLSRVDIRLGKLGHHRKYRLPMISTSMSKTYSYDLTRFVNNHDQHRVIYFILPNRIEHEIFSLFFYSKSKKNLFSFASTKTFPRRFRRTILPTNPHSTCAKHEYEIDFRQFSFGQWIVQPKRFNAYTCSGSCPNPLSAQYYPSNHAILLSLIRSQREHGQQPLCVPVRLKPLCLLYYDRDELVIKYHRDMIVQECGCR